MCNKLFILLWTIAVQETRFLVCNLSKKEMAFVGYVRRYGKVTVPKGVREALGIEEGALVECRIRRVK